MWCMGVVEPGMGKMRLDYESFEFGLKGIESILSQLHPTTCGSTEQHDESVYSSLRYAVVVHGGCVSGKRAPHLC